MDDKKDIAYLEEMRKKELKITKLEEQVKMFSEQVDELRAKHKHEYEGSLYQKCDRLEVENTELKHNIMHKDKYTRIVQDEVKRLTEENEMLKKREKIVISPSYVETNHPEGDLIMSTSVKEYVFRIRKDLAEAKQRIEDLEKEPRSERSLSVGKIEEMILDSINELLPNDFYEKKITDLATAIASGDVWEEE